MEDKIICEKIDRIENMAVRDGRVFVRMRMNGRERAQEYLFSPEEGKLFFLSGREILLHTADAARLRQELSFLRRIADSVEVRRQAKAPLLGGTLALLGGNVRPDPERTYPCVFFDHEKNNIIRARSFGLLRNELRKERCGVERQKLDEAFYEAMGRIAAQTEDPVLARMAEYRRESVSENFLEHEWQLGVLRRMRKGGCTEWILPVTPMRLLSYIFRPMAGPFYYFFEVDINGTRYKGCCPRGGDTFFAETENGLCSCHLMPNEVDAFREMAEREVSAVRGYR